MKKSFKKIAFVGFATIILVATTMLCSCKSSKSNGGIMYQHNPQKNTGVIKSNYKVVSENQTTTVDDFELPRI